MARSARDPAHRDRRGDAARLTVDGADEVSPNLDLVKGRGAAFVRERIVAASSRRQIIIVTPEKMVERARRDRSDPGRGHPDGLGSCTAPAQGAGGRPAPRAEPKAGGPFVSDNGNLIFDATLAAAGRSRGCRASRGAAVSDPGRRRHRALPRQPRSACWSATPTGASRRAGRNGRRTLEPPECCRRILEDGRPPDGAGPPPT